MSLRHTWQTWTGAPHRVMFLLGALQLVATMLWWLIDLAGRYGGAYTPPVWSVPPAWGHAFLMLYTTFPLFAFGFTMTAMPHWLHQPITRRAWLPAALPMGAALPLVYTGFATHRLVAAAGVTVLLCGWVAGWTTLVRLLAGNRMRDMHALGIVVVLAVGGLLVAAFNLSLYTDDWRYADFSRRAGVWLFLLPLFLTVTHRLVPFISNPAIRRHALYRPRGALIFLAAGCLVHFALAARGDARWTWLADLPLAAWSGYLALRWGLAKTFRVRLLAMLHGALVALSAAFALHGLASLAALMGYPALFGFGPLHALAIGYFTTMTVAMVSQVTLGHAGRAQEADPLIWHTYRAVLAIAAIRALADVAFVPAALRAALMVLAAAIWLIVFGRWCARYAPIYLRPRADGKPG